MRRTKPPATGALLAALAIVAVAVGGACRDDNTADPPPTGAVSGPATSSPAGEAGAVYTIVAGDTLSGIAGRAGVSLEELIVANGWSDGSAHLIVPGDRIVLPAGAQTPAPRASTTAADEPRGDTAGDGEPPADGGERVGGYVATGRQFAGATYLDDTDPIVDPLRDGIYAAEATGSDGSTITFLLYQQISGATCAQRYPDDDGDMCVSPPVVDDADPTTVRSVAGSDLRSASVVTGDTIEAIRLDGDELARLVAGEPPADDAPAGFEYIPYAFIVTVSGGLIVTADQQFHS